MDIIGTHQVAITLFCRVPPGAKPEQVAQAVVGGISFSFAVRSLVQDEVKVEIQALGPNPGLVQ